MIQIKPDPDGTSKPVETSGSCDLSHSIETPCLRAVLGVSSDDHQAAGLRTNRSFRPIAPKPSTSSPSISLPIPPNPTQATEPYRCVSASVSTDEAGFVSFGGFERHFVSANRQLHVPRAEYANAIVPHKHLNVFGRNTLRLYQIVPKSRTMGFTVTTTRTAPCSQNRTSAARSQNQDDLSVQPNYTDWTCSHQTIRSKRAEVNASNGDLKAKTSDIPSAPEAASSQIDQTTDRSVPNQPDCSTGFVLNVNRLRPSVQLLSRIGRQLVQSQYKYLTIDECGCGAVRHLTDADINPDEDRISADTESDTAESPLAERESSHLEWRKKPANTRWNRVRALCEGQKCPFIPASIFQLHRHLEQGHQSLVHCPPPRSRRKVAASGPEYSCDFLIPLVVDPQTRGSTKVGCPVCPDFKRPLGYVVNHISQAHPFISASLLCKPFRHFCAICGAFITNLSSSRASVSGSFVHTACQPSLSTVRHAAWANFDAHPLACLMLNPNRHSRLSMSELMVRHLYQSMDYVLSINVSQLHLWSIDSCTLRCSLAISSLFGEIIRVHMRKQSVLPFRDEELELNPSEASQLIANDSSKSITSLETPPCSIVTDNPPAPIVSTSISDRLSATPSPSQSAPHQSAPNIDVSIPIEAPTSTRKRTRANSESTSFESVEPESKQSRKSNNETPERPDNRLESDRTILVDLTNGHGEDPVENCPDGTDLVQITPPKASESDQTRIPGLPHPLSRQPPEQAIEGGRMCVPRMNRVLQEPCELCGSCVRSCRQHLIESHACNVGSSPTQFCLCCGRLFWTEEGCDQHQNLKCSVCSKEVCHATMFMHLGAEHRDYFLHLLEIRPLVCPVCHNKFPEARRFLSHSRLVHQCLLPREVCDDFSLRLPGFPLHQSLRGAALADLVRLHTQCKQNLRKRNASAPPVPFNIVSYDTSGSKLPIYSCSVCCSAFVSVTHLDFHVQLTGHQYWCALCQFACLTATDLVAHDSACHALKVVNSAQVRLVRPVGSTNGLHATPKLISSATGPILSSALPASLRQPQPFVTGQLHSCTLCPVFCLSLEDLNVHRVTAHGRRPLTDPSKTVRPMHPRSIAAGTTAPGTVIVGPGDDPVSSTVLHYRPPLNDVSSKRPRLLLPNTNTGGLNTIVNLRPPILVRPTSSFTQPSFTVPLRPPSVSSATAPGAFSTVDPNAADLTCPMCEFQSKSRAEVMQHIVDVH